MFLPVKKEMKLSTSNSSRKKYKALMLDVDGTIVVFRKGTTPSSKVKHAVIKAHRKIKVGLATARPLWDVIYIIKDLEIDMPCIVAGGAQIYDPLKEKIVWEKRIEYKDALKILKIAKQFKLEVIDIADEKPTGKNDFKNYRKRKPSQFWIESLDKKLMATFISEVSRIPTISIIEVPSWNLQNTGVLISHAQATKQHGILEVAKSLNIKTSEIIGVGDSNNDFPLLMACGLKIAMGNANEELKQIADYVAPSVENDGVAHIIKKFVL